MQKDDKVLKRIMEETRIYLNPEPSFEVVELTKSQNNLTLGYNVSIEFIFDYQYGFILGQDYKLYKSILKMQEVIVEFFQRFRSDITESIYAVKGIQDYQKLRTFYDYLDYDRQTIYREKRDSGPCGLRNIGNTCYLNVFLQILYHINFLREKIFANQNNKSRVLQELKYLFGRMQLGKLVYADPSNLFQQLKRKHPEVFIQGVQNDFHEICTILLDELKESLRQTSQNDSKMIDKMLFGKLTVKTYHSEGKSSRNTRFNIINLDSSFQNLQNALQHWKYYQIEDYMTENKKRVKASVQTQFIQTPALLTFFINRVSFKNNTLVKDNRQFGFENSIYLRKTSCNSKDGTQKLTKSFSSKEEQLLQQKQKLKWWIQKVEKHKQTLKMTLKYLEQKQFTNINVPQIQNKFQQGSKVKEYLQQEIKLIEVKIDETRQQMIYIDDKISRLFQENQTQLYHLWGMMIHEGTNPTSGHYKVVLNTDSESWVQFNDRKVEAIDHGKINSYRQKGQICCLLYRRPTLLCSQKRVAISGALKNKVQEIQKLIMLQVDKARVLQNLYQLNQSSGCLLQHQIKYKDQNRWFYFFKPIMHCFEDKHSFTQCQGVLTYESLKDQQNLRKMQSNFLIQRVLTIPDLSLQIPIQYFQYQQIFKAFLKKQTSLELVDQAYEWLAQSVCIPVKNKTVLKWVEKYLQVIVMKGVFYLCVLYRATITPLIQAKFTRLFRSIEKLMKKLSITSDFTLTYIPIKDQIQRLFNQKANNSPCSKSQFIKILRPTSNDSISRLICQNYCQLFKQRLGFWISEREKLSQIDEGIINSQAELHNKYIIELA